MPDLASKSCIPCRAGSPPLPAAEQARLLQQLDDGWTVAEGHHLEAEFRFRNFSDALGFVNQIGTIAEEEGHHPDLELSWGRVGVKVLTHSIDGLTESDFVLAAKIDRLREEPLSPA